MRRRGSLTLARCQQLLVIPAGFITGIILWAVTVGLYEEESPPEPWSGANWPDYDIATVPVSRPQPAPPRPLHTWSGICNVVPIEAVMGDFKCVRYNVAPHPLICFEGQEDNAITKSLYSGEVPDQKKMLLIQAQLLQDPDANLIDINSIYGLSGLVAAKMDCHVIFVQTNSSQVDMLVMSVITSLTSFNKTRVLRNVIHKERVMLPVRPPPIANLLPHMPRPHKQQTFQAVQSIILNDLMEVISFNRTIICITLGLDDVNWLDKGDKLFSSVYVSFIFMRFNLPDQKRDKLLGMFNILYSSFFQAYNMNLVLLKAEYFMNWPNNIIWKHDNATFVPTSYLES